MVNPGGWPDRTPQPSAACYGLENAEHSAYGRIWRLTLGSAGASQVWVWDVVLREGYPMPTYVVLGKWTEQGVRNVKETVTRVEQRNARIEQLGGRVIGRWWTQGAYDAVDVLEMPDDETASALVLSGAMLANTRTETMRAYTAGPHGRGRPGVCIPGSNCDPIPGPGR